MNKKSTSSKVLNLRNPKQLRILRSISVAEGRIAKEEIMKMGNKEIFYRMKNNGFIRETEKGSQIYKATKKLNNLISKSEGISVGNGCSSKHSKAILNIVKELPHSILDDGRYITGMNLKQEMEIYKKSKQYHIALKQLQLQNSNIREDRERYHKHMQQFGNRVERLQEGINYKADTNYLNMRHEILGSENPLFVPDFAAQIHKHEAEKVLMYMKTKQETLKMNSREQRFLEENCKKMEQIINDMDITTTVYFEIVTDSYGKPEMERHEIYERIMNRTVLYLC